MARASSPKIGIKSFRASFNGVNEKGELPERLKIFEWGVNKTNQGDFILDDKSAEVFSRNQVMLARQTIPIDFNHTSVEGTPAFAAAKGVPDIGGYGQPVIVNGCGMFVEAIETTPSGIKKASDFKDLSAAPLVDEKTGRIVGLHSLALVPAGSDEGLTIESAALRALSATLRTLSVPDAHFQTSNKKSVPAADRGEDAEKFRTAMNDEHMEFIKHFLKMPENCTYEDVMEKLKAHLEMHGGGVKGPLDSPEHGTDIVMATLTAKFEETLLAKLTPLQASVNRMQEDLTARAAQLEEAERKAVIDEASRQGKVIPLSADT